MAARKNTRHLDRTREKIKTSQLINRLNKIALGEIEATTQQVRAIEIGLKKSLPDLQSIEYVGEGGGPLTVQIVRYANSSTTE